MSSPIDTEKFANEPLTKESLRELIKTIVLQTGKELSKEDKTEQAKALVKYFEEGINPAVSLKLNDRDLANMYSYGFSLYNSGKYQESKAMFTYLLSLVPGYPCFLQGLAASHHRLKEYELAGYYYVQAGMSEPTNPLHYFYAFDCYQNIDDRQSAMEMLASTILAAKSDPKYNKVLANAEALLEGMLEKYPDEFKRIDSSAQPQD